MNAGFGDFGIDMFTEGNAGTLARIDLASAIVQVPTLGADLRSEISDFRSGGAGPAAFWK